MKIKNWRHKQSNKLEGNWSWNYQFPLFSYSVYDTVAYELCDQAKTKMTEEVEGQTNHNASSHSLSASFLLATLII